MMLRRQKKMQRAQGQQQQEERETIPLAMPTIAAGFAKSRWSSVSPSDSKRWWAEEAGA